jgi:hypothetical protein
MKFVALVQGRGEGCDYTIACNVKFLFLKSENWDEVKKEIKDIYEYHGMHPHDKGEAIIESITVVEITESRDYSNFEALFAEEIEAEKMKKAEKEVAAKEAEFERLKKELGK